MPFTPFHFGPGFFIKSIASKWFSFRVFILTNIITDLEPLYYILHNQWPAHRFFHTYLGATFIAMICAVIANPIFYSMALVWNILFKNFKVEKVNIPKVTLIISALIGTYSHVFLDSFMHRDMIPWYPVSEYNSLLERLGFIEIHFLCVLLGIAGLGIYLLVIVYKRVRGALVG